MQKGGQDEVVDIEDMTINSDEDGKSELKKKKKK